MPYFETLLQARFLKCLTLGERFSIHFRNFGTKLFFFFHGGQSKERVEQSLCSIGHENLAKNCRLPNES